MKYLVNTCISSFLILFILVFATNAEENKKKFEEKKKKKFEERLKNMRPEVKDHIFSEIDDGDGVISGDQFPLDPTQWADRDNDGLGDNPNGNNPFVKNEEGEELLIFAFKPSVNS